MMLIFFVLQIYRQTPISDPKRIKPLPFPILSTNTISGTAKTTWPTETLETPPGTRREQNLGQRVRFFKEQQARERRNAIRPSGNNHLRREHVQLGGKPLEHT